MVQFTIYWTLSSDRRTHEVSRGAMQQAGPATPRSQELVSTQSNNVPHVVARQVLSTITGSILTFPNGLRRARFLW